MSELKMGLSAGKKIGRYAKDNPEQAKKAAEQSKKAAKWARDNPEHAKKAYQLGSSYYKDNDDPGDPKNMGRAAGKYAKENPEQAKKGAAWARDNPDTFVKGLNYATNDRSRGYMPEPSSSPDERRRLNDSPGRNQSPPPRRSYDYDEPTKNPSESYQSASTRYTSRYNQSPPAGRYDDDPTNELLRPYEPAPSRFTSKSSTYKPATQYNYSQPTSRNDDDSDDELSKPYEPAPSRFKSITTTTPYRSASSYSTGTSAYTTTPSYTYSDNTTVTSTYSYANESSNTYNSNTYSYSEESTASTPGSTNLPPKVPPRPHPHELDIKVTALYDFEGTEPNDLSFKAGDVILVTRSSYRKDDWWEGRLGDATGNIPANYFLRE